MKTQEQWFKRLTGQGVRYWMDRVGHLIHKHSKPHPKDKKLQNSFPDCWVADLAKELWSALKPRISDLADENIATSRVLSVLLTLWTARIIRAKAYDPRRAPADRRKVLRRVCQDYHTRILACLTDESHDHEYFPAQEWDNPFPRTARYEPDEMELRRQKVTGRRKARRT